MYDGWEIGSYEGASEVMLFFVIREISTAVAVLMQCKFCTPFRVNKLRSNNNKDFHILNGKEKFYGKIDIFKSV